MRNETIDKILNYLRENDGVFTECIEDLDSYNGYLGDDRYYEMEILDEFFAEQNPLEILQRAYFGYDEDDYIVNDGERKVRAEFNPNKRYFTFNGYGNLVSSDWKDYTDHLDKWFVEKLAEYRDDIYAITDELGELLDELANDDE